MELFAFTVPPLELFVRGTAMYWFLFLLFRVVLRRDAGAIAIADVLLLVLIADAAQNAMAGDYKSIGDGIVLVSTIAGWNVLLNWLNYRFAPLRRWLEPPPLPLVRDGRLLPNNLRRELVTRDELMSKLRENGVEQLSDVKVAYMEGSGEVSVLRRDEPKAAPRHAKPPEAARGG